MAVNEFGCDIGMEGQIFPFVPNSIETGYIQEDVAKAGGFALWGKTGEPGKVYANKPNSGAVFAGLAQLTTVNEGYEQGDIINVMKKGRMYVITAAESSAGGNVYIDENGKITSASSHTSGGSSVNNEQIAGATFKTNAGANKLVEVEIA